MRRHRGERCKPKWNRIECGGITTVVWDVSEERLGRHSCGATPHHSSSCSGQARPGVQPAWASRRRRSGLRLISQRSPKGWLACATPLLVAGGAGGLVVGGQFRLGVACTQTVQNKQNKCRQKGGQLLGAWWGGGEAQTWSTRCLHSPTVATPGGWRTCDGHVRPVLHCELSLALQTKQYSGTASKAVQRCSRRSGGCVAM